MKRKIIISWDRHRTSKRLSRCQDKNKLALWIRKDAWFAKTLREFLISWLREGLSVWVGVLSLSELVYMLNTNARYKGFEKVSLPSRAEKRKVILERDQEYRDYLARQDAWLKQHGGSNEER